jgi:hypothetical protein
VILTGTGRIVSSAVINDEPLRNAPIAAWYRDVAPGEVEVRLRLTEDSRKLVYRIEEDAMWWRHTDGVDYPWKAVDPAMTLLPEWWQALLTCANERMNRWEREAASSS